MLAAQMTSDGEKDQSCPEWKVEMGNYHPEKET